jgi:hypothetical protein
MTCAIIGFINGEERMIAFSGPIPRQGEIIRILGRPHQDFVVMSVVWFVGLITSDGVPLDVRVNVTEVPTWAPATPTIGWSP